MTAPSTAKSKRNASHRRHLLGAAFLVLHAALFWDHLSETPGGSFRVLAFAPSLSLPARGLWSSTANKRHRLGGSGRVLVSPALLGKGTQDENGTNNLDDIQVLRDLVLASSLSYLSSNDGKMEASPYFSGSGLIPLAQVVEPKTESGATIFEYGTTLVVACRGSATPINFSTNLRFRLVPLDDGDDNDDPSFLVHEGFREATTGLWDLLDKALADKDDDDANKTVVFTGHSLGAATAVLCAAKYQHARGSLAGVVTFGGPRFTNRAHWNDGLLENVVVRNYVHDKDPILRQNYPLWDALGFGIVGTEIKCEAYEPVVYPDKKNGEDGNLPIAWNILDHCNYLGVFVGPRLV